MSRIAFFGTPDFAATILNGLLDYCNQNGHTIGFVVCQPDRPKGRNQLVEPLKVKMLALENKVEVLQPSTLKPGSCDGDFLFKKLESSNLDLAIVVAYGKIIPTRMLKQPKFGFVNVHASLLPRWRGASPIHRAIQSGDKMTGVSIMDLVPEMDAGDVYKIKAIPILKEDNTETLSTRLADVGLETLLECLENILRGEMPKTPQSLEGITYAPKLSKEDGKISWHKTAEHILNHARAMYPWPQSYTTFRQTTVKLFGAKISQEHNSNDQTLPGTVLAINDFLLVKCIDGVVTFDALQFEGKRRMTTRDVKNGNLLHVGDQFSTD